MLTRPLLEQLLAALQGRAAPQDPVQVVDAFAVPFIVYDPVRKLFHRPAQGAAPSLQADASVRGGWHVCRRPAALHVGAGRRSGSFAAAMLPTAANRRRPHASSLLLLLLPLLQSKVALYVNRFHLVHQRLKRNKLFRPAQVHAGAACCCWPAAAAEPLCLLLALPANCCPA